MKDLNEPVKLSAYDQAKINARELLAGKDLKKVAKTWCQVRDELEAVAARKAELEAWNEIIAFEVIPDLMDKEGIENVNYDGIGKITTEAEVFVSIPADNREDFYAWLRKHRMADLITETVNASTLKSWIKGRMKEGKNWPGDLLKVTPATRAKLSRSKG